MKRKTKTGKTKWRRGRVMRAVVPILVVLMLLMVERPGSQAASGDDAVHLEAIADSTETSSPDGLLASVSETPDINAMEAGDVSNGATGGAETIQPQGAVVSGLGDIPSYEGEPFTEVNGNVPYFTDDDLSTASYEHYGELDSLGRCTAAFACVGTDLMPTEERGSIGNVKPTGWHQNKYEVGTDIDSPWIYNRCHLIAYQLTGENDNPKNLITGTRAFNTKMLIYENMVADYIKNTGNHVLYRVTPVFDGDDLLARGVLMEGESVEDDGAGITFCVFCHNVQHGVTLDYATGENWASD